MTFSQHKISRTSTKPIEENPCFPVKLGFCVNVIKASKLVSQRKQKYFGNFSHNIYI